MALLTPPDPTEEVAQPALRPRSPTAEDPHPMIYTTCRGATPSSGAGSPTSPPDAFAGFGDTPAAGPGGPRDRAGCPGPPRRAANGGVAVIDPADPSQVLNVPTVAVGPDGVVLPTAGTVAGAWLVRSRSTVNQPATARTRPGITNLMEPRGSDMAVPEAAGHT